MLLLVKILLISNIVLCTCYTIAFIVCFIVYPQYWIYELIGGGISFICAAELTNVFKKYYNNHKRYQSDEYNNQINTD